MTEGVFENTDVELIAFYLLLTQAYRILKVTHGNDHPITTDLLMKMEECRAEMVQQSSR